MFFFQLMVHCTKHLLPKNSFSEDNDEPELLHALRYIPNLFYLKFSFKTNDKNKSYARKTDLQPPKSFNPNRVPETAPPILLFETSSVNRSILALRINFYQLSRTARPPSSGITLRAASVRSLLSESLRFEQQVFGICSPSHF